MVNRRTAVFSFALCVFISSPLFAITRSWTGAVSANWSDSANWSPSGTPVPIDSLVFPAGSSNRTMTNDLPAGTSVGPLTFNDSYTLNGNPLTLTADLSFGNDVFFTCNTDLKLASSLHFRAAIQSMYNGAVDVNGQTLTIDSYNTYLNGAVNGSGAIVILFSGVPIAIGGTFSGTISGVFDIEGSMPGATVTTPHLSGNGSVGAVSGQLTPGGWNPSYSADPHTTGVLHTKALTTSGMGIDLNPAASSDQVQVTGTVTISGGATLQVTIASGSPSTGQTFTIIDNDGADPVNGTFSGLPEGATLSFGTSTLTISYHGGDGNDVVLTTLSSVKTWKGTFSGLWSDGRNWSPQGVPSSGEALLFPAGATTLTLTTVTITNDLPAGTIVGPMTFNDSYRLNGNPLTLTGDLSFGNDVFFTCNADLKAANSLRFRAATQSIFNGAIDVNGQTLTIDTYNTYLNGAVNGSGAIVVTGAGVPIKIGGTFTGPISGAVLDIQGPMPGATVTTPQLTGDGSVGTVNAGRVAPGGWYPGYFADPHTTGVLHTKTLTMSGLAIDLNPDASSDQVQVTGTANISGLLQVSIPSGSPAAGQSFTIIDNDGADPVNGTFSGLPEGATLSFGTSTLAISYHGGDGNDVVLTTASAIKTWKGTFSGQWSDGRNWSPQGVPSSGEALLFPAGSPLTMTNDLPAGTIVGPMTFNASYTLNGNSLTLTGDLSFGNDVFFTCNADLKIANSLHFRAATQSIFNGAIDVNGQTLTIDTYNTYLNGAVNGSGAIVVTGAGVPIKIGGTFTGPISGAVLDIQGPMPGATVTTPQLTGDGSVGTVNADRVAPGGWYPGYSADPHTTGVLHTKTLTMSGLAIDLKPAASSDQVQVTGTVNISGVLQVSVPVGVPSTGQNFTIIDNDGTDPVTGIFSGLPEGTTLVTPSSYRFRISYVGGDGNDVTLASLIDTTAALSQSVDTTRFGEPFTLTAIVTAQSGTPTGSVMFTSDGTAIGTVPLVNGVATLTATTLVARSHSIVASFIGTGAFADRVSGSVSHIVTRGQTKAQIAADHPNSLYGQTVRFTVTVSVQAPASGQPGGSVTVLVDGNAVGTVPVVNGTAVFETALLHAGLKSITATYSGDANFESSSASSMQQNVGKAHTHVDASAGSVFIGASPAIKVSVSVLERPALVPPGTASVSDAGTVLDVKQLVDGSANFTLAPLAEGDHRLVVSFSGDADFEESSATVIQSVIAPAISFHGTRVDEGNHGVTAATIVVTLSAAVSQPVRVSFTTVAGSATEGEDYEKAGGVIEFAPGQVTRSIEIHILGDTVPEADETFFVLLHDPLNAAIESPSAAIVIANDDQVPTRHRPSRP